MISNSTLKAADSGFYSSTLASTKRLSFGAKDSLSSLSHSSSTGLVSSRATKRNATVIRQSPFGAAGRVGKTVDDPQYYRFTLRRNTNQVQIGVKNLEAGGIFAAFTPTLQFSLERPNGKVVGSRTVEGGEVEGLNNLPLARGTYFIRVTSAKGQSVPYNIGFRAGAGLLS